MSLHMQVAFEVTEVNMNVQGRDSNVVVDTVGPQVPISEGCCLLLGHWPQSQSLQQWPGQPRAHI